MATIDVGSYVPNSNKYKRELMEKGEETEREKLAPVVDSSKIVSTKKSLGRKFSDVFLNEDAKDVKKYVVFDVIIPGIKSTILNIVSMMFFGQTVSRGFGGMGDQNRRRSGSYYDYDYDYNRSYTDYRGSYSGGSRRDSSKYYRADEKIDYRSIILNARSDAEILVDKMRARIKCNGTVTVAEFFDMLNIPGKFTDNDWGWDDERDIGVKRVPNGFLIDVAEAKFLR